MTFVVLEMLTFVAAALRAHGVKTPLFQALVHVFVGGLFGAGLKGERRCLDLAIALTVLEVACFLAGRFFFPLG